MNAPVATHQRFTRNRPCPVCGGHENMPRDKGERCYGFLSSDGRYAHCSREEQAGGLMIHPDSGAYPHRLDGPCQCGHTHGTVLAPAPKPPTPRFFLESHFKDCEAGSPWDFEDETGHVLYRVARHPGKKIFVYHVNGRGAWTNGAGTDRRVLLDLPKVNAWIAEHQVIYLCEGPKKARMLQALGLPSTSNSFGASGFTDQEAENLRGAACVVVVLDNDKVGRRRGAEVPPMLHRAGVHEVRTLLPPGAGEGQGIDDWLAARADSLDSAVRAELEALADAAPRWEPRAETEATTDQGAVEYLDLSANVPPVPWLLEGWVAEGDVVLLSGDGGIGKSTTAGALAMAVATGGNWCGIGATRAGTVLVLDEEQSARELTRLYVRLGAPHENLHVASQQGLNLTTPDGLARIEHELQEWAPLLVVLDSVQQVFTGVDGNDAAAVAKVYAELFRLRRLYGCAFLLIGHLRKPPSDGRMAKLHMVHGSVAFGTQASTVWVASQPVRGLMDLVQVKRRDGERTSLRIRYTTDGPGAPITLSGEGSIEEGETSTERAEDFVLAHLATHGPSSHGTILSAGQAESPPLIGRSIERALKRMVEVLKSIEKPKRGYYALPRPQLGGVDS